MGKENWHIKFNERFATVPPKPCKDPIVGLHPDVIFTDWHLNDTIVYEGLKYSYKDEDHDA